MTAAFIALGIVFAGLAPVALYADWIGRDYQD